MIGENMTQEEKIDAFETQLLPEVKEDVLWVMEYFERKKLPSAYTSCLQMYLANFMGFSAKPWDEHCDGYGIKMDFKELEDAIEKIKGLDDYVEEFR